MRPALILVLLAVALCGTPLRCLAQETNEVAQSCESAWLASDWPNVVTNCATMANSDELSAERTVMGSEASAAPQDDEAAQDMEADNHYFAGAAWARAAAAYAKLDQMSLADHARGEALADLARAIGGDVWQKARALKDFINSGTFYADAPGSPLLAHI